MPVLDHIPPHPQEFFIDSSGNGNDATDAGSVFRLSTTWCNGLLPGVDLAVKGPGVSIDLGPFSDFPGGTVGPGQYPAYGGDGESFSFDMWHQADPAFGATTLFGGFTSLLYFTDGPNIGKFRIDNAFGSFSMLQPGAPTDFLPHHFGFSLRKTSNTTFTDDLNIYVDGSLVYNTPTYQGSGQGFFYIGSAGSQGQGGGIYDEVAFYNYALGTGQFAAHYNAGLSSAFDYSNSVMASNPHCYYHLDELIHPISGGAGWAVGSVAMGP